MSMSFSFFYCCSSNVERTKYVPFRDDPIAPARLRVPLLAGRWLMVAAWLRVPCGVQPLAQAGARTDDSISREDPLAKFNCLHAAN